ncbi:amidase signature domain-containing protein [Lasiosphaeria hispida]|uniref:Amidase signature domain-containing protein n=1 Tax=Lasiosphaeria hispida TaxID=260671 RepID=A0AAJ0HES3_9PEZI|nr:amidase signature domain-containing protein [Lasiosphaeria hispida]
MAQNRKFLNYPEPLKGPDIPYKNERKKNPALRGIVLIAAAFFMESFRFLREMIWRNAGFGSLREIVSHIEDYEPWFEPQVVPLSESEDSDVESERAAGQEVTTLDAESKPGSRAIYPEAKYYSVADYRNLYLSGALTPTEVAAVLLPLIRRDVPNPTEHSKAWFETDVEKVMAAARESTRRYKGNRSLGPLDGVPTAVKDEYDMKGYRTCLGSKNTYVNAEDDIETTWCVQKLEAAGAIILGKLSMHEFGLDTTGNNPIYETPRNPYNPNYYTGGSSSGTGYAVSTGLIPIGLGSDGGGSIRIPAALCGVFGLKPTHGRLSFKPGQNHCVTCACLGPIASDVASLATVFQVIASPHPTSPFPPLSLTLTQPAQKLLGIPTAWFSQSTPAIQTLCNTFIRALVNTHGYTAVPITIPFLPQGQIAHAMTVLSDAATLLPDTANLTPANRILLALGRVTPSTDYLLAQKLRRLLMQHLAWLWKEHPGLLIVTPTTSCEGWPIRGGGAELRYGVNDGDTTLQSMEYVWLANFCGLPSISVPAGFVLAARSMGGGDLEGGGAGEVPVGLMATGEWCAEEGLLRFAAVAEEVGAGLRRRPAGWVDVVQRVSEAKES